MKSIFLALLIPIISFSQVNKKPIAVDEKIEMKINSEVEHEANLLKKKLLEIKSSSQLEVEFQLDTFKVEAYLKRYFEYDYSDMGMKDGFYRATDKYDFLLNKYYKLLYSKLDKEDKRLLVQAQKSWINFRDDDGRFKYLFSYKPNYGGGGTLDTLVVADEYFNIVKERVLQLFALIIKIE